MPCRARHGSVCGVLGHMRAHIRPHIRDIVLLTIECVLWLPFGHARWALDNIEGPPKLGAPEGRCISFSPNVKSKV